jgi:hypothetical protein
MAEFRQFVKRGVAVLARLAVPHHVAVKFGDAQAGRANEPGNGERLDGLLLEGLKPQNLFTIYRHAGSLACRGRLSRNTCKRGDDDPYGADGGVGHAARHREQADDGLARVARVGWHAGPRSRPYRHALGYG